MKSVRQSSIYQDINEKKKKKEEEYTGVNIFQALHSVY